MYRLPGPFFVKPILLFGLLLCLTSGFAVGQEVSRVLHSEYNGLCKSLFSYACDAPSKKAQQSPLQLTRMGAGAASLHHQRQFERRTIDRITRRSAKKSLGLVDKTYSYVGAVNEQDSLALVALYNALDGTNWADNTGWLAGPVSSWFGVTLNDNGRVVELSLRSNTLFGMLPAELTTLSELLFLDLADNFLLGSIPDQIANLVNLEVLDLSFNLLSESIPESIGSMSRLFDLVLWGNNLSGEIPVSLSNLPNIELLSLEFNDLEGPIPSQLGELITLKELYLDQNQLSGSIPAELGNLSNLVSVFLGSNNLTGSVPVELSAIEGLRVLSLSNANLSGPWPVSIANLTQLTDLDLGFNNFEGPFPEEYLDLFFLANLFLNNNFLTGQIPANIGFLLPNLTELSLAGNQLEGPIPASIGQLLVLSLLDLSFNQLSGSFPDLNANQRLRFLYLNQNNLAGDLTNQFEALFTLIELNLSGNNLSGEIPDWLDNSPFMERVWLASNEFVGSIPESLTALDNLIVLDLWNNNLIGSIPADVVNQVNLVTMDLGWNKLSGNLPGSMDQLDLLENLFLDRNALKGPLNESLTGAESIRVLILNENELTRIPDLSAVVSLDSVSLSLNFLGFDSIEPNMETASGRISYIPQRLIPMIADELDMGIRYSAEIGGSANQYQWFLANTSLAGANEAVYEAPYDELSSSDELVLEVTSQIVTDLTLETVPVRVDARLSNVVVAPPSQVVAPGDNVQFEFAGVDQFSMIRTFTSSWSAEGGTIDDNGLYVAGEVPGVYTIAILDALGSPVGSTTVTIVGEGVNNEEIEVGILEYALRGNFPNPFTSSTELIVDVPQADYVQLHVYNVLGQELLTVVDQHLNKGTHRFTVDGDQWPAGVYFVALHTNDKVRTHTMVKTH